MKRRFNLIVSNVEVTTVGKKVSLDKICRKFICEIFHNLKLLDPFRTLYIHGKGARRVRESAGRAGDFSFAGWQLFAG